MCPVIRACQKLNVDHFVLHTGQHYSYSMDRVFFEELELPDADYNLEVGSGSHAEQTGKIMSGVERVLVEEVPSVVLVQGDTNTVLAGALAAAKLGIKVGHVEAGLRSYDRTMPEEINRVLADHISDYLFVPTEIARRNLASEGITKGVIRTGNTVVDAVRQNRRLAEKKSNVMRRLKVEKGGFVLATAHRQENVDHEERLRGMIEGMRLVGRHLGVPVIFPAHPRTQKRIEEFGVDTEPIRMLDPVGYLDFLQLEANAALALTDSGGVQEETCILGVRCVTLRNNTERPETVEVGSNLLAGTDSKKILAQAKRMLASKKGWSNPFGDGKAGERIVRRVSR